MADVIVNTAKFTVKARQLNESVYELHRPQGEPTVQVLFFHGFQREYENAHLFTWTCGDESGLWPQTWLVEKFPDAHILSISYSARTDRTGLKDLLKHVDMYIVVENLLSNLLDAKIGQEPRCPVILVGHSFGGLIVKDLCVKMLTVLALDSTGEDESRTEQLRSLVDNVKGVFFYATPHHGIEDNNIKLLDQELLIPKGPLSELVKSLSNSTARLNSDFEKLARGKKWWVAGLGETLQSKWAWFGGLIVPEGSSRYGTFNMAEGVDHFSIARPENIITRSFTAIKSLLEGIADDPKLYGPAENLQLLPESIVGIENVLDTVKSKLQQTTQLGFVGMGGVGKTTLAMALFNDIEKSYHYTCFIKDVKNLPGSQDLRVEDALLKHLHYGGKKFKVGRTGINVLKGKRLLLVLDDLSSEKELDIVSKLWRFVHVHAGSRLIATCRDRVTLETLELFTVDFLSPESAKTLFEKSAFPMGPISPALERYIPGIVGKCEGLPLSLEVIGKHLRRKDEPVWKEALDVLDNADGGSNLDEKLWNVLKLSFDGLSSEEKNMFLDAVTVFYKSKLSNAMAAWKITVNVGPETKWQRLVESSLVWEVSQVNESGLKPGPEKITIGMHEQIWSLFKKIISDRLESGCRSRIWYESEKALSLLSTDNGDQDDLKDISALKLCSELNIDKNGGQGTTFTPENLISRLARKLEKWCSGWVGQGMTSTRGNRISISGRKLRKMTNLQYLWLEGVDIEETNGLELAETVVNLHLSNVNFSGFTLNPHKKYSMNVLEIDGCAGLRELPSDIFERLPGLEHIQLLDISLRRVPDLEVLRSVKTVRLRWVPRASFPRLPKCLGYITEKKFPGSYTFETLNGKFVPKLVQDTHKLNDSLYQLYGPEPRAPEFDIIFFHGLQANGYEDAYWKSWMSSDGTTLWPQTLLADKFPNARMLSVSYDSAAQKTSSGGGADLMQIAENFVDDIILSELQRSNRPIFLVGHSLGGLVLKYLITSAHQIRERSTDTEKKDIIDKFLDNVYGIFYYSTPHSGTRLAEIVAGIPDRRGDVSAFLKTLSKESARLNVDFAKWRQENGAPATSLGESVPTDPKIWGVKGMKPIVIVDKASCTTDTDDFHSVNANHVTICQPNNDIQRSFSTLERFVSERLSLPKGVILPIQVNDSLYEFCAPRVNYSPYEFDAPQLGEPQIDIIFFHGHHRGYEDAYWKTWMSSDGKTLWPRTLLGKKFPNARIMSVGIGSPIMWHNSETSFRLNGDNLVSDIIFFDYGRQIGDRPIILVGHSVGGLMLKYFVAESAPRARKNCDPNNPGDARKIDQIDRFLTNVCGIFFYSTPHTGTELIDLASKISGSFRLTPRKLSAILNEEFGLWRTREGVKVASLREALPTSLDQIWGVNLRRPIMIVPEEFRSRDTDSLDTVPNTNHITICQPNNEDEMNFYTLEQFVRQRLEEVSNPVAERSGDVESAFVHAPEASDQTSVATNNDKRSERASHTEVIEGAREVRGHPQRYSAQGGNLPPGITKLNDSLYQFYAPQHGEPQIDIIFFHGLRAGDYRDAYWDTWMSSDGEMLWPRTLLAKKFPNARIMSVSYDSGAQKTSTSGNGDFYDIGANFVEDVILSDHHPQIGDRPIILVGHCLGGRLLNYFVTESAPRVRKNCNPKETKDALKISMIDNFLNNVCGVFYYSTPHHGTDLASKIPGPRSEVLVFLEYLSHESHVLNQEFWGWRNRNGVAAASLIAVLPTDPKIWGVKGMKPTQIVEEAACRRGSDSFYNVADANHITVCQPKTEFEHSFIKLANFVGDCLEEKLIRSEDSLNQ